MGVFYYRCCLLFLWSSYGCLPQQIWDSYCHHRRMLVMFSGSHNGFVCESKDDRHPLPYLQFTLWDWHIGYLRLCNSHCISLFCKKKILRSRGINSRPGIGDNDSWSNSAGFSEHFGLEKLVPSICWCSVCGISHWSLSSSRDIVPK